MEVNNLANRLIEILDSDEGTGRMILERVREILMSPTEDELNEMYEDYISSKNTGVVNTSVVNNF